MLCELVGELVEVRVGHGGLVYITQMIFKLLEEKSTLQSKHVKIIAIEKLKNKTPNTDKRKKSFFLFKKIFS